MKLVDEEKRAEVSQNFMFIFISNTWANFKEQKPYACVYYIYNEKIQTCMFRTRHLRTKIFRTRKFRTENHQITE